MVYPTVSHGVVSIHVASFVKGQSNETRLRKLTLRMHIGLAAMLVASRSCGLRVSTYLAVCPGVKGSTSIKTISVVEMKAYLCFAALISQRVTHSSPMKRGR